MSRLQNITDILGDLIAFPTVSTESNLDLIHYAANRLEALSAKVDVQHNRTGGKANLFATIGPAVDGGIILSGHSDVVPVEGQDWSSDPFQAKESGDLIYGRGACDMKGFIAAALALAPEFAAANLERPLHIALTHDEETGCLGAQELFRSLENLGLRPALAIVGEPTEMRVIEGHKGCCEYTTRFTGLEGHGSLPHLGVNAVEYAVRYVNRLMELREEMPARAPALSRFDPPWTTVQVGRLSGGIAHNVIPGEALLDWEMRPVQKSDADYIKKEIAEYAEQILRPEMQAVSPKADIVTTVVGEVGGLEPMAENEAVKLVAKLTGANGTDLVAFGTEAGLIQGLGIHTVVCGPGSIEQAHKPDEYVAKDQLIKAADMIAGLQHTLAGRSS